MPFCLGKAVNEHLLLQRKNCVHVIAHDDLRLANHALQSLNGIRCCHDGELTILQVDEFDSSPGRRPRVARTWTGIVIWPLAFTVAVAMMDT